MNEKILVLLLCYLVLISIIYIFTDKPFKLTIVAGSFSVLSALLYLILGAADVSITEAAIGSCLSTIFFMGSIKSIKNFYVKDRFNYMKFFIAALTFGFFAFFLKDLELDKENKFSRREEVVNYYIENTRDKLKFPNLVTAILASFRGYDTLGETTVILTAAMSILLIRQNENNT